MELSEFLDHLSSGKTVEAGSEPHQFMHRASQEALRITADEMAARGGETSLADDAIHFALLSYAAGVASSRYVALLRQQKDAEAKKTKQERE